MKEKNIQELAIRMGLISVENMCQYTITQLVVMVANKVNELVGEVWRFETDVQEILKTQNDNIQYLLGEGLHLEIENIFDGWFKDGTFDSLINQTALKQVSDRIDETNAQLSQIKTIKADKEELNALGRLQFSGEYSTLQELQLAYPSGHEGLYLVISDGYIYRWSGIEWTKTVPFQSDGIADYSIPEVKLKPELANLINKQHIKVFGGITDIKAQGLKFIVSTSSFVIYDKSGNKWLFNGVSDFELGEETILYADIVNNKASGTYELATTTHPYSDVTDKIVICGNYFGRIFSDITLNIQTKLQTIDANATNIENQKQLTNIKSSLVAMPYSEQCDVLFDYTTKILKTLGKIYIRKANGTNSSFVIPPFEKTLTDYSIVYVELDTILNATNTELTEDDIKLGFTYSDFNPNTHIPLFWYSNGQIMTSTGLNINSQLTYIRESMVAFPYDTNVKILFNPDTRKLTTDGKIYIRKETQVTKSFILPTLEFTMENFEVIYIDPKDIVRDAADFPVDKIYKGTVYDSFDTRQHIPLFWYANGQIMTSLRLNIQLERVGNSKNVVLFGDSLTELQNYPEILAEYTDYNVYDCSFAGSVMAYHDDSNYQNLGFMEISKSIISGDFSKQRTAIDNIANGSNKEPNYTTLTTIDFNNIDTIVVLYGTNDWGNNMVLGSVSDSKDTVSLVGGMKTGIENILSVYPHIQFYFITPPYRENCMELRSNKNLKEWGDVICETSNSYGFPSLNGIANLGINEQNSGYYLVSDKLHLSTNGAKLIASKVGNFIK